MIEKVLGKIRNVSFGRSGYQDGQFGMSLEFEWGGCCGTCSGIFGGWSLMVKCDTHCKWTEADRDRQNADMCRKVDSILGDAKVNCVQQLKGKPVEITLDGNSLKEWRILTEVL